MNQTQIITAPKVNVLPPLDVNDKPFTVGAFIHKAVERQSGIYKIQSKKNPKKCYIGSSHHINVRQKEHFNLLRQKKHHSMKLQNHYNKYGEDDLLFNILLSCDKNKESLLLKEQYFIDIYNPFFNICPLAKSRLGSKSSPETKKKISEAGKGRIMSIETRILMSEKRKLQIPPMLGRKHSEKTKKLMSEKAMGRQPWLGKHHSEETKQKMRISRQINIDNNKILPL